MDAAVIYYQALRVYPSPLDMLILYKQQLPAPIMEVCPSILLDKEFG